MNTLIYEVNLEIDAAIADAYRAWLREHVAQMLTLPGFLAAQVFEVLDPPPASGRIALCCQYRLCDADALQAYFDHHAATMRADGIARFGDRFRATRRVLRSAWRG